MRYLAFLLLFLLIFTASAIAEPRVRSEKIYDDVMSPYCPGVTLSACTSPNARGLRTQIDSWVIQGLDEEEIKSKLIETYGQSILGVPSTKGFDLVGWLLPIVCVTGGACGIWLLLSANVGRKEESKKDIKNEVDVEMQERIEKELKSRLS